MLAAVASSSTSVSSSPAPPLASGESLAVSMPLSSGVAPTSMRPSLNSKALAPDPGGGDHHGGVDGGASERPGSDGRPRRSRRRPRSSPSTMPPSGRTWVRPGAGFEQADLVDLRLGLDELAGRLGGGDRERVGQRDAVVAKAPGAGVVAGVAGGEQDGGQKEE